MILIDADIVTFRAAFSAEDEPEAWVACSRADAMISEMAGILGTSSIELWLSGDNNFRYQVYPEYKANRINAKRPKWEKDVKAYLIKEYNANISNGCEADDMLGIRQFELGADSIIATIDKDLDMIPGWHYNFVKKEKYFVTPEEAIRFFYYQCLIGDTADGIKGVSGIGPKKAKNILDACDEEATRSPVDRERLYYETVLEKFSCYEEFAMTAKCLWIWRTKNGIWKDRYLDPST